MSKIIYVIFEMGPYEENYHIYDYKFFDNYDYACNTLNMLKEIHKGSNYEIKEFIEFEG